MMGAIDPIVARQHVKTKSASVEGAPVAARGVASYLAPRGLLLAHQVAPSIRCSAINLRTCSAEEEEDDEDDDAFFHYKKSQPQWVASTGGVGGAGGGMARPRLNSRAQSTPDAAAQAQRAPPETDQKQQRQLSTEAGACLTKQSSIAPPTPSAATRAKNFLTAAIGSFSPGLRPAASASCLISSLPSTSNLATSEAPAGAKHEDCAQPASAKEQIVKQQPAAATSKSALLAATIPTRASLTHQWRKLRTPAKCRDCAQLVYFNGRECATCGFIAHKKCLVTLVIKCATPTSRAYGFGASAAAAAHWATPARSLTAPSSPLARNALASGHAPSQPQPIFGQPLGGHHAAASNSEQVLDFVRRFIYEIDTRGLTARGIYRVSSIKSKVDRLCQYYDQNPSNLIDLSSFHPNIIANALKIYLRQLPEPLLTHKLYQDFIDIAKKYSSSATQSARPMHPAGPCSSSASSSSSSLSGGGGASTSAPVHAHQQHACQSHQQRLPSRPSLALLRTHKARLGHLYRSSLTGSPMSAPAQPQQQQQQSQPPHNESEAAPFEQRFIEDARRVVDALPPINKDLVALIMRHLHRVADMSDENQMSAKNLSIIFGPTLLDLEVANKSLAIVDNIHQARIVELMIQWAYEIFPRSSAGGGGGDDDESMASLIEPDYSSHVSC